MFLSLILFSQFQSQIHVEAMKHRMVLLLIKRATWRIVAPTSKHRYIIFLRYMIFFFLNCSNTKRNNTKKNWQNRLFCETRKNIVRFFLNNFFVILKQVVQGSYSYTGQWKIRYGCNDSNYHYITISYTCNALVIYITVSHFAY